MPSILVMYKQEFHYGRDDWYPCKTNFELLPFCSSTVFKIEFFMGVMLVLCILKTRELCFGETYN